MGLYSYVCNSATVWSGLEAFGLEHCGLVLVASHIHTHPFNGPLSRTTRVSRYQKAKTNLDFTEARDSSGSGISWAICKSAPGCRQITMAAPHYSVFTGRVSFLPPSQQRQSTEGSLVASLEVIDDVAADVCSRCVSSYRRLAAAARLIGAR